MTPRTSKRLVGLRVVLVAPPATGGDKALAATLDAIASYGWTLVGVMPPDKWRDALRLVLADMADFVLSPRAEYVPAVRFTGDLRALARKGTQRTQRTGLIPRTTAVDEWMRRNPVARLAGPRRSQPVDRDGGHAAAEPLDLPRRTQPAIRGDAESGSRTGRTRELRTARTEPAGHPVTEAPQAAAEPAVRGRRASDRHGRSGRARGRRRTA